MIRSDSSWVSRTGVVAILLCSMLGLTDCTATRGASQYRAGSRALARGDITRAILKLEAANASLPDRSEILNHLGIAYDKAGRSEDAMRAFEQAVAADCRNNAAESNLMVARQRAKWISPAGEASGEPLADPVPVGDPSVGRGSDPVEASQPVTPDEPSGR